MPNSNLPIQRASSTWETSASMALATRTRNTLPATSCAMRLSLRSARIALTRAIRPAAEKGEAGRAVSVSLSATGSLRAGGGRDAKDGKAIVAQ